MLTPEEIFEKEFKRSLRGYDINEVNEFLDQIIQDYARLLEENKTLKKETQQLKGSANRKDYHSLESNNQSIELLDIVKRIEKLEKKTRFL